MELRMKHPTASSYLTVLLVFSLVVCTRCSKDNSPADNQTTPLDSGDDSKSKLDSGQGESESSVPDFLDEVSSIDSYSNIPAVESDPDCQLQGKWISVQRTLSLALNGKIQQAGHSWDYWEFEQTGTKVTVTKGLKCGVGMIDRTQPSYSRVLSGESLWKALTKHIFNTDRKGVYGRYQSDQCFLGFEHWYLVRGATVPYFIDHPDVSIDEAKTKAEGDTPGWEDWDQDGKPGVTYGLAGIATGELFVAQREWSEYFGPTVKNAVSFKLKDAWNVEQVVIDKSPETLPSADSWPSTEPGENFVVFVRVDTLKNSNGSKLWDVPADADDETICEKMRSVKDTVVDEPVIQADLAIQNSK
jgi:hypothetical protein